MNPFTEKLHTLRADALSHQLIYGKQSKSYKTRRTPIEIAAFHCKLWDIVRANQPCSVRNVYYLAVSAHLIEKDTAGSRRNYSLIVNALGDMRENEELPWKWIPDYTRYRQGPEQFNSIELAIDATVKRYRRDLWQTQDYFVDVWCESDSIRGVIGNVTASLGVDILPCRGQSSKRLIYDAAQLYSAITKPVLVFYVGDWDPTGLAIPRSVEERLARYGGRKIVIRRLAVTAEQIPGLIDAGHVSNQDDSNYHRFIEECKRNGLDHLSYETEAIPPNELRRLVTNAIRDCIDTKLWTEQEELESVERKRWLEKLRMEYSD
jgi:hypothetical protein